MWNFIMVLHHQNISFIKFFNSFTRSYKIDLIYQLQLYFNFNLQSDQSNFQFHFYSYFYQSKIIHFFLIILQFLFLFAIFYIFWIFLFSVKMFLPILRSILKNHYFCFLFFLLFLIQSILISNLLLYGILTYYQLLI